ncbi:hydantoinase B/oxoprolinase family protein [Qaidamihabitans albus]|uniref:hydantoinase B/oxoprolinase family protein n=1 Tax=Qaidamihabitans albus TaxID=2795733 RepID=UPI0018F13B4B|nr:hydantoinase B/oxoprolinase family protein [Qaidamihabitans albus]
MTDALDPVSLEVIRNGLLTAADEMKNVVLRTAYSNLWKEAGDLSCALLSTSGEVVAQGSADIPIHLPTMPYSFAGLIERFPLESMRPGDVFLHNDPYRGNNHLPDFFMLKPVFHSDTLLGFAAVRGHFIDVGGNGPGSYSSTAPDIQAEGFRIPPMRIWKEGVRNDELVELLATNVRNPRERLGDLHAQYAGCGTGERRLQALADKYGTASLLTAITGVLDDAETLARTKIAEIPDGRYEFQDFCDGDGIVNEPFVIRCVVEVSGSDVRIDFTGTSSQTQGGMNMALSVCFAACVYAIKALTDPESPANSGAYRPVTVTAPPGTVVNVTYPGAVVAGNHETSARVADCVTGALAAALPDRVVAAGAGSTGVLVYGGHHEDRDFICVEMHGAGQGGGLDADGGNAHRVSIANTGNTPVEALELAYPLTVLDYRISEDAGGAGRFRGGCGIQRRVRFDATGWITIVAERGSHPPYGLFGGQPAEPTRVVLTRAGGDVQELPTKTPPLLVHPGDELFLKCAGGGGYGPPQQRDRQALQDDLDDGYVTPRSARDRYGADIVRDVQRPDGQWVVR